MPATSLTPAMPAIAPLTRATPRSVRSTRMPAKRAAWGERPTARIRRPAAVRPMTYQATTTMTIAMRKPRWSRDRSSSWGKSAASAIGGDSVMPVGSRHGPWTSAWTISSATGFSSRVVTTSSMPSRARSSAGTSAHAAPASAPAATIERDREYRRPALDEHARPPRPPPPPRAAGPRRRCSSSRPGTRSRPRCPRRGAASRSRGPRGTGTREVSGVRK